MTPKVNIGFFPEQHAAFIAAKADKNHRHEAHTSF